MPDIKEAGQGKETKRKFDKRDFNFVAEWAMDELSTRKTKREDREKHWKEIDRQIAMQPDTRHKKNKRGDPIAERAWMSEIEMPLQAQTLEVLCADARRMMFPDQGLWFRAHAALTDEYLRRVDFESLVAGDENEVPSEINQDNADKLASGLLNHWHRQYDFRGHWDKVNAEAFKYGVGIGRARLGIRKILRDSSNGVMKETHRFPIFVPRSIKSTYLDEKNVAVMNEGLILGPTVLHVERFKLADLIFAANRGKTNPNDPMGGWMPAMLRGLEEDDEDGVTVVELEGDIVVPRKTTASIVLDNAIATVVAGKKGGKASAKVIRLRFRNVPYSTYIPVRYHIEHVDDAYATSPLEKGRPLQIAASQALNRSMDAAALNTAPPTSYDRDDIYFAQSGGPKIEPYAKWETNGEVNVHNFSNPGPMAGVFTTLVGLYFNQTGVNPPRLGAQTVSHTTAFAKGVEVDRGASRTVDYVNTTGQGPLTQWLNMAFDMGRKVVGSGTTRFYIPEYRGWVDINKDALPDDVEFEWIGAAGPADEQARMQKRLSSAQLALSVDQLAVSFGKEPKLDHGELIEEILREGGWVDTDAITRDEDVPAGAEPGPSVEGVDGADAQNPSAALQAIAFGRR